MTKQTLDRCLGLEIESVIRETFVKYDIAQDKTKDFLEITTKIANEVHTAVKQLIENMAIDE